MKIGAILTLVAVTLVQLVQFAKSSTNIKCPEFYTGLHLEEEIHNKFVSLFDTGKNVSFDKT
jgi:hypothetical protein